MKSAPQIQRIQELEASWKKHGPGITEGQFSTGRLPVEAIRTCEEVFQPRLKSLSASEIDQNISDLTRLLDKDDDVKQKGFDPLLVFPIAGEFYILDGHCRLAAYRKAGREYCRVRVFRGTFREAIAEAVRSNATVKLSMKNKERNEAAWRLACFNATLPEGHPERLSVRALASVSSVPASTVGRMMKLLKEGLSHHPNIPRETIMGWSWALACAVKSGAVNPENAATFEKDQERLNKLADNMNRLMRRTISANPHLFWPALYRAFGPSLVEQLKGYAQHMENGDF